MFYKRFWKNVMLTLATFRLFDQKYSTNFIFVKIENFIFVKIVKYYYNIKKLFKKTTINYK